MRLIDGKLHASCRWFFRVSVVIRELLQCAFGSFCQGTNHTQVALSVRREVIFLGSDEVVPCCGSWWNWLLNEMR